MESPRIFITEPASMAAAPRWPWAAPARGVGVGCALAVAADDVVVVDMSTFGPTLKRFPARGSPNFNWDAKWDTLNLLLSSKLGSFVQSTLAKYDLTSLSKSLG